MERGGHPAAGTEKQRRVRYRGDEEPALGADRTDASGNAPDQAEKRETGAIGDGGRDREAAAGEGGEGWGQGGDAPYLAERRLPREELVRVEHPGRREEVGGGGEEATPRCGG